MKQLRMDAEQGDADACVPENDAEAVKWYRLAAEQGYALAQFHLGRTSTDWNSTRVSWSLYVQSLVALLQQTCSQFY